MSKFEFNAEDWQADQEAQHAHNEQVAPEEQVAKMPWETEVEQVDSRIASVIEGLNIPSVVENPVVDEPEKTKRKSKAGRPSIKKHMEVNIPYRNAYKKYMDDCTARKEAVINSKQAVKDAVRERAVLVGQWTQHIANLRLKVAEAKAAPVTLPPRKEDY